MLHVIDAVHVERCVGDGAERRWGVSAFGLLHGLDSRLYLLHHDGLFLKVAFHELLLLLLDFNQFPLPVFA